MQLHSPNGQYGSSFPFHCCSGITCIQFLLFPYDAILICQQKWMQGPIFKDRWVFEEHSGTILLGNWSSVCLISIFISVICIGTVASVPAVLAVIEGSSAPHQKWSLVQHLPQCNTSLCSRFYNNIGVATVWLINKMLLCNCAEYFL